MNKYGIVIFQLAAIIVSAVFLLIHPLGHISVNILAYLFIAAGSMIVAAKVNKRAAAEYNRQINSLRKEISRFNFEVQVSSSQISSVSQQLAITLDENNAFAQQLYAETKEMASLNSEANSNINSTISGVKNIIELLEDAGETISDMGETSEASNNVIKSSLNEIMEIVNTINEIKKSSNGTMEYMDKLNTTSGEIIHILETVSNISKQTQMLALNASIESARAGESGKGFAVVAGEIGKLATDTSEAVKDVNKLIKSIQDEISSVFKVVRENSSKVETGVRVSCNIEKNLSKIDMSFSKVIDMVAKINELFHQEVLMTKDIEDRIGEVEKIMNVTEKSVEDVKQSVRKQKNSVEDIAEMGIRLNESSRSLEELFSLSDSGASISVDKNKINEAVQSFRLICGELANGGLLDSMDKSVHRALLEKIIKNNLFIEAAWTNESRGKFICSIPEAGIANAGVREWFKRGIAGEEYVSPVYISAITKNPCITLSAPLKDNVGRITGVIGIDVKLQ